MLDDFALLRIINVKCAFGTDVFLHAPTREIRYRVLCERSVLAAFPRCGGEGGKRPTPTVPRSARGGEEGRKGGGGGGGRQVSASRSLYLSELIARAPCRAGPTLTAVDLRGEAFSSRQRCLPDSCCASRWPRATGRARAADLTSTCASPWSKRGKPPGASSGSRWLCTSRRRDPPSTCESTRASPTLPAPFDRAPAARRFIRTGGAFRVHALRRSFTRSLVLNELLCFHRVTGTTCSFVGHVGLVG